MKQKLKENIYLLIGEFFIWIIPLVILIFTATESKTNKVAFKLWGGVALCVVAVIYFVALRRKINAKIEREKIENCKVPAWLRVIQGISTMCIMVALILVVDTAKSMYEEIMTFLILTAVSVFVGYLFLICDSKSRKKRSLVRKEE